ncbi:DNA-directed RNA polymerase V subunit 7-like [Wolffia australiana]
MVFLEAKLSWAVSVQPEDLHAEALKLRQAIVLRLLEQFAAKKALPEEGYLVALTTIESIGDGKITDLAGGAAVFSVDFKCITFKPLSGEIMVGIVKKVLFAGVLMAAGPLEEVFLSVKVMGGDYEYAGGDEPFFMGRKNSFRMRMGTRVRFKVLGFRWMEVERGFQVLASLAGDFLGPLSEEMLP